VPFRNKSYSAQANCSGLSDTFQMSGGSLFHWLGKKQQNQICQCWHAARPGSCVVLRSGQPSDHQMKIDYTSYQGKSTMFKTWATISQPWWHRGVSVQRGCELHVSDLCRTQLPLLHHRCLRLLLREFKHDLCIQCSDFVTAVSNIPGDDQTLQNIVKPKKKHKNPRKL